MNQLISVQLFNSVLGGVVALILILSYFKPRFPWHILGSLSMLCATVSLVVLDPDINRFYLMQLLCYLIFLHGTLFLFGVGIFLRKTYRISALLARILAILLVLVALDAFVIEPKWLEVSHYTVESEKITKPIKIAVISDLQTDEIGNYEKGVFQQVMDAKPDLILLPGDYIQLHNKQEREKVIKDFQVYLKSIKFNAPLGVYAVKGNVETLMSDWPRIFNGLPIRTITGKETVRLKEIDLTGLGLWESFDTAIKINRPNKRKFHLVFGHGPDYALGSVDADLMVAGHTHGGQVQVPFFGPPITLSFVPRGWAEGKTALPNNKTLIVSRGIGMEREPAPRLRFLCRPELVFIQLKPMPN